MPFRVDISHIQLKVRKRSRAAIDVNSVAAHNEYVVLVLVPTTAMVSAGGSSSRSYEKMQQQKQAQKWHIGGTTRHFAE